MSPAASAAPAAPASAAAPIAASTGPSLTKIDAQGNALPADAAEYFAVRVIDGSIRFDILAGYVSEKRLDHDEAIAACTALDAGGFTDWRLPTVRELFAIVDHARVGPAVDPQFFPHMKPNWHWSSSPAASDPGFAWVVSFDDGHVNLYHRGHGAFVRAVRSVPASQ